MMKLSQLHLEGISLRNFTSASSSSTTSTTPTKDGKDIKRKELSTAHKKAKSMPI